MTLMRRRYVASTSLRRHVPAGNLAPKYPKPWPPKYSKPSYAYEILRRDLLMRRRQKLHAYIRRHQSAKYACGALAMRFITKFQTAPLFIRSIGTTFTYCYKWLFIWSQLLAFNIKQEQTCFCTIPIGTFERNRM